MRVVLVMIGKAAVHSNLLMYPHVLVNSNWS